MVDKISSEVRPVERGGSSLEHAGGRGMTSVEVVHHSRAERPWDDWAVMKHDDRSNCDKAVAMRIEILKRTVPRVPVLWRST